MTSARFLFVACIVAVLATRRARAESPVVVSRAQAIALGAQQGPAAREANAPVDAATRMGSESRALLPFSPRVTAFAGRRTGSFGAGPEVGVSVTQELSLHGLGARREEVAAAVRRSTLDELARARLEGAALAALAFVDLLEAQELARVRALARRDAGEIARVARARTERGVALPLESALAMAEVGSAELGERDAEGRIFEARTALQFALGLPPSADVATVGDLKVTREPSEPTGAREHPLETAARSRVGLARADARLARAQASSPFALGVNVSREATGEQLVTGTVTLPVPLFDPSRFDAARHRTMVAASEAEARRLHDERQRDSAIAAHERLHTREVHETLASNVLTPLRESVRLARASYQAGTQDVTAFLLLRQRLVGAEEQLAHAAANVQRADVRYDVSQGMLVR